MLIIITLSSYLQLPYNSQQLFLPYATVFKFNLTKQKHLQFIS